MNVDGVMKETEDHPPLKRTKIENGKNHDTNDVDIFENASWDNIISPDVLTRTDQIFKSYQTSKPYPHGVISKIYVDGFLDHVLEEVKHNSKVKFKESDLFRVYQSIDLGNLNPLDTVLSAKMPNLMKLRETLYCPEFRSFMEKITGLDPGTLTDKVDCAVNCHAPGCHLLCHDDVIETRKVSYILYLTDRDPLWKDEDGGRLELYESICEENIHSKEHGTLKKGEKESIERRRVPNPIPVKTVLPAFNSMAFFVVEPGFSFHSVQEVFCDRPRLSIQGWYHANKTPLHINDATLNRLKSTESGEDTEGAFHPMDKVDGANDKISQVDIEFLSKYINKTYLEIKSLDAIRERFEDDSCIQLRHFLNEEWAEKVKAAISSEDKNCQFGMGLPSLDYSAGINNSWKIVGPAHKQRFLEFKGEASNDDKSAGSLLSHLKLKLFESASYGRLLDKICSLGMPHGYRGRVRRFRPGLDYTVAHYGILTKQSVLDATICFAAGTGDQCRYNEQTEELIGDDADAKWESGDVGGFECYISADDDDEDEKIEQQAADEYNDDDDTELLSVSVSFNTLSLVYRDPGTMRFVKYVGCSAPSSRWDVSLEYEVEQDEDEVEAIEQDEDEVDANKQDKDEDEVDANK
eukprot:CAMPEP_0197827362 /NCGR_PEP_ID=MMETSP1437-20131217/4155_1 /TAXON_ID=49252 ORGANISM="Eucampia antarctica, Strain CCMP1452" /NCGR_SAMPLE_ID=MMETSP1437 /ASSEMBLY_ACC=CAM_ASM_001096 /LENGTH=634 /DNA_ID=CAMNT_0043428173 /DNA_START=68 /DNA_END=1969 /DNA_ORIENTATION=-